MARFVATVRFEANIEFDASDLETAIAKAHAIADENSVYKDDVIETMHDSAYCAGGAGEDPPLKRKKAFDLRNKDFNVSDEIEVRRM